MRLGFAPASFLVAYCGAYVFVLAQDMPMFRYYPLHSDFSWGTGYLTGVGPAMAWYGLMANAGVFALVLALLVPQRVTERVLGGYLWLVPVATLLACVYLMRPFFL
jgi:hypothetical protein